MFKSLTMKENSQRIQPRIPRIGRLMNDLILRSYSCLNWFIVDIYKLLMTFRKLISKYSIVLFLNGNTSAVRDTAIRDKLMKSEIRNENGRTLQLAANIPGYKSQKN